MKLGTKVGLSPGHIVLDGESAPPFQKGQIYATFECIYILLCNNIVDRLMSRRPTERVTGQYFKLSEPRSYS